MADDYDLNGAVQRAKAILRRADAERDALAAQLQARARLLSQRAATTATLATNGPARANLLKLATMAARVEGAYYDHAAALSDYAVDAVNLAKTDALLAE